MLMTVRGQLWSSCRTSGGGPARDVDAAPPRRHVRRDAAGRRARLHALTTLGPRRRDNQRAAFHRLALLRARVDARLGARGWAHRAGGPARSRQGPARRALSPLLLRAAGARGGAAPRRLGLVGRRAARADAARAPQLHPHARHRNRTQARLRANARARRAHAATHARRRGRAPMEPQKGAGRTRMRALVRKQAHAHARTGKWIADA
eukprot:5158175-Pleurochrysis_carterae.AAC.1